jgi:uncharacterized membrane protein
MEATGVLDALFRWIHVVAGILWIGHLYFFNFVNAPLGTALDGPTKKVVVPQLMPRALYWFRWGAAWTWVTGLLLLLLVFYHGRAAFETVTGLGGGAILMLLLAIVVMPVVYDQVAKSGLGKDLTTLGAVGFVLTAVAICLFHYVGGFGYRGFVIHTGAMFGTIMAFNVWMRIWPAQQKIITATRDGIAPDAALVAMAGARSRHNVYMSVPLVWMMINAHTSTFATTPGGSIVFLLLAILVGWAAVYWLYSKAPQVKGF